VITPAEITCHRALPLFDTSRSVASTRTGWHAFPAGASTWSISGSQHRFLVLPVGIARARIHRSGFRTIENEEDRSPRAAFGKDHNCRPTWDDEGAPGGPPNAQSPAREAPDTALKPHRLTYCGSTWQYMAMAARSELNHW